MEKTNYSKDIKKLWRDGIQSHRFKNEGRPAFQSDYIREIINYYFYKLSVRKVWHSSKEEFKKLSTYDMYELLAWEELRIEEDKKAAANANNQTPPAIPNDPNMEDKIESKLPD